MSTSSKSSQHSSKEKVKKWLSNPYNLWIVLLLLLGFSLRIYFFVQTMGQPLWWDEAEYMATAKKWAFGVPYDINLQRPPLFQLLGAGLLAAGFSESALIFLLVIIPSTLLIGTTYLLGKSLFNEKVGIIGALGSTVIWTFLFWTNRFQPDFISLNFQVLSLLFFWKMFNEQKRSFAIYAGLFAALGFYFKISALLVPLSMFAFVLIKDGISFVKNKIYWTAFASYVVSMVPFSIWQFIVFGNPFAFAPSYIQGTGIGQGWNFGWMALSFYKSFPLGLFFILFLVGLVLSLGYFALRYDLLFKDKKMRLNGSVFSLTCLIILSLFYIFYIRGTIEDRWVFLMVPFIFFFAAKGLEEIASFAQKYWNHASTAIILLAVCVLMYSQITYAGDLIDAKKEAYIPVKEGSLFIKSISQPEESVLSVSYTQATAYTERKVYTYSKMSEENFTKLLLEKRPSYLMASILEPHHPTWLIQQVTFDNNQGWGIIMDYFNSSIAVSSQGQVIQYDVKQSVQKEGFRFDLVYPLDELNGVFVYRITYT